MNGLVYVINHRICWMVTVNLMSKTIPMTFWFRISTAILFWSGTSNKIYFQIKLPCWYENKQKLGMKQFHLKRPYYTQCQRCSCNTTWWISQKTYDQNQLVDTHLLKDCWYHLVSCGVKNDAKINRVFTYQENCVLRI